MPSTRFQRRTSRPISRRFRRWLQPGPTPNSRQKNSNSCWRLLEICIEGLAPVSLVALAKYLCHTCFQSELPAKERSNKTHPAPPASAKRCSNLAFPHHQECFPMQVCIGQDFCRLATGKQLGIQHLFNPRGAFSARDAPRFYLEQTNVPESNSIRSRRGRGIDTYL